MRWVIKLIWYMFYSPPFCPSTTKACIRDFPPSKIVLIYLICKIYCTSCRQYHAHVTSCITIHSLQIINWLGSLCKQQARGYWSGSVSWMGGIKTCFYNLHLKTSFWPRELNKKRTVFEGVKGTGEWLRRRILWNVELYDAKKETEDKWLQDIRRCFKFMSVSFSIKSSVMDLSILQL